MRPLLNPNGSKAWQESDGYIRDCANCGRKDVDALLWDEDSSCGYCGDYFCGIDEGDGICGQAVFSGEWPEGSPLHGKNVCDNCLYEAIDIGFTPHCGLDNIPPYIPRVSRLLNWNRNQVKYLLGR